MAVPTTLPAGQESSAYADAPNRLVAFAIDAVILTVLVFLTSVLVSVVFGPVVELDSDGSSPLEVDQGLAVVDATIATLVSLVYFVGTWRWLRGSPGQRSLGMRLTNELGDALTLSRGVFRWLPIGLPLGIAAVLIAVLPGLGDLLVDLVVLIWYALLLSTIAGSRTKQGWHDRLAGSVVVKRARMAPDAC